MISSNALKLSKKIALLLVADELNELSPTGGQRRLRRLLEQPVQVVQVALKKAELLRAEPWNFSSQWEQHGEYLNRYQAPKPIRRPAFQQRKRGYTDKGTAAPAGTRQRREADQLGSTWQALEQFSFTSSDYDDEGRGDRWVDLLFSGTAVATAEQINEESRRIRREA